MDEPIRAHDQIFFIYDQQSLQNQDDDIGDSLLYFDPKLTTRNEQCILVGQVVGIVECVSSFASSPVNVVHLGVSNIIIKHVEHYILGLSGHSSMPVQVLQQLIDALFDLFCFFHGSIDSFRKNCQQSDLSFSAEFNLAWDGYLAYIRRFGDTVSSNFQSLSYLYHSKDEESSVVVMCRDLINKVRDSIPGVRAGCVLYKNKVLLSQLPSSINLKLCVIQPKQHHLSCVHVDGVAELPEGVRLLSVSVLKTEFAELSSRLSATDEATSSFRHRQNGTVQSRSTSSCPTDSLSSDVSSVATESQEDRTRYHGVDSFASYRDDRVDESDFDSTSCDQLAHAVSLNGGTDCQANRVPLELYIQGNSQSVFLLLTNPGSISGSKAINQIWVNVLQCLAEMEVNLAEDNVVVDDKSSKRLIPNGFSYLLYRSDSRELTGNALKPVWSSEHEFCSTCLRMQQTFQQCPETKSLTLSGPNHTCGGIQRGTKQLFYQYRRPKNDGGGGSSWRTKSDPETSAAPSARLIKQLLTDS